MVMQTTKVSFYCSVTVLLRAWEPERTTFGRKWRLWRPVLTMGDFSLFFKTNIIVWCRKISYENRRTLQRNRKEKVENKAKVAFE
jgi:hypothetical protein